MLFSVSIVEKGTGFRTETSAPCGDNDVRWIVTIEGPGTLGTSASLKTIYQLNDDRRKCGGNNNKSSLVEN